MRCSFEKENFVIWWYSQSLNFSFRLLTMKKDEVLSFTLSFLSQKGNGSFVSAKLGNFSFIIPRKSLWYLQSPLRPLDPSRNVTVGVPARSSATVPPSALAVDSSGVFETSVSWSWQCLCRWWKVCNEKRRWVPLRPPRRREMWGFPFRIVRFRRIWSCV